ncbi:uncharacterized protein LOC129965403 [Argiope bruennichi]|uniref:uncharacterized protein LOC129965403 n=1 Tax=Argiope bruennichi TaxID=94029 RepID=UPI0024942A27|nr:uncharacterized protein LOC129965403 [Argiope bruennichi]
MKQALESVGQRRIFNKALQSALRSSSLSQNDPVACKGKCKITENKTASAYRPNTHKPKSTEVMAASCENPLLIDMNASSSSPSPDSEAIPFLTKSAFDRESLNTVQNQAASLSDLPSMHIPNPADAMATNFQNPCLMKNNNEYNLPTNHVTETSLSDLHFWVRNTHMASIQETLNMVPSDDTDAWIIKNRLMALQQLKSDFPDQYFSSLSISPPSMTDSSGEISPVAMYNPSDLGAFNISPLSSRNSLSSANSSLKDAPLTNEKCKFEKHDRRIMHQQDGIKLELMLGRNFSKNEKSSGENSLFRGKLQSGFKTDQSTGVIDKNTKQYLYEKSYQEKETGPKNSKSGSSNVDCCETFHNNHMDKNKNNVAKLASYDVASLMVLKSTTGFFDSHCHIDLLLAREKFQGTYADYMAQHKDSYPQSYKGCIAVFCKPLTFAKKQMWQKHLEQDNVWGAFGCHPKSAKFYDGKTEEDLLNALNHPKVKALGEIGLDYSKGNQCSKLEQHHAFRRQLRIAQERKLRLVIHCQDADADTIKIMHEILPRDTIFHLHCFTGSWKRAQKWIQEFPNVFIGITNLVTFPSATPTHEVVRQLPLERLLLETDAPYFVPSVVPKGTNSSHPGMAIHVAAHIAALRKISGDTVLHWTSTNTRIVYNIT